MGSQIVEAVKPLVDALPDGPPSRETLIAGAFADALVQVVYESLIARVERLYR